MHLRIAENHNRVNRQRFIVNVTHAARKADVSTEILDEGWIIRLTKGSQTRYIYGDKFDLNTSAAAHIAHDKAATFAVLRKAGIAAVPHHLLALIKTAKGVEYDEIAVRTFMQTASLPVVCKPLEGSCGNELHLFETEDEIHAFAAMASSSQVWALSPFFHITTEYRTVVVDGEVLLQYAKTPSWHEVHGGKVEAKAGATGKGFALHGLSQGGKASKIDDEYRASSLTRRALAVTQLLNLRTASVDIILAKGKLLVLEVNDGIALDGYGAQNASNHHQAIAIYQKIIMSMFA